MPVLKSQHQPNTAKQARGANLWRRASHAQVSSSPPIPQCAQTPGRQRRVDGHARKGRTKVMTEAENEVRPLRLPTCPSGLLTISLSFHRADAPVPSARIIAPLLAGALRGFLPHSRSRRQRVFQLRFRPSDKGETKPRQPRTNSVIGGCSMFRCVPFASFPRLRLLVRVLTAPCFLLHLTSLSLPSRVYLPLFDYPDSPVS